MAVFSQIVLLGLGSFLIIVILLQRGRGGGLAGAFGGLGGQSAFGTKAGDVFTKITIVIAVAWVIVAGGSGFFLRAGAEQRAQGLGDGEAQMSTGEEGDSVLGEEDGFDPNATSELPIGDNAGEADRPEAATDTDAAASDTTDSEATDDATSNKDAADADAGAESDDSSDK